MAVRVPDQGWQMRKPVEVAHFLQSDGSILSYVELHERPRPLLTRLFQKRNLQWTCGLRVPSIKDAK